MDISDFFDSFFEEAGELLEEMERHLLDLDPDEPDMEQLNAIFRAAHSIKGGAGAFGFVILQETTHIMENRLDEARKGELQLTDAIVDVFLKTKDVLDSQIACYRAGEEPDQESFEQACAALKNLDGDGKSGMLPATNPSSNSKPTTARQAPVIDAERHARDPLGCICEMLQFIASDSAESSVAVTVATQAEDTSSATGGMLEENLQRLRVELLNVAEEDSKLLLEELKHFGAIVSSQAKDANFEVIIDTNAGADGIEAVMCFVIEPEQIRISRLEEPAVSSAAPKPTPKPAAESRKGGRKQAAQDGGESTTIRVPVEKVDQIINLVGELIITQSMLQQSVNLLDSGSASLERGMSMLQRNARDLQEAVMSVRMVPMEYVFSRFPRMVRDTAAKLGKEVELVTEGKSTELDKGLIERITDPLTHLVRNSLDHGIEKVEARLAVGKPKSGRLSISARQQGGNIFIEVGDDGGGLNREKLLAKARSNGLPVSDEMSDAEVYQLIFAPGFSTAEQVSDISGRGVGMDVVRRNIQSMGGHVEIMSEFGKGTTTRIVLPLTLAIMDGMLMRVANEMFVLPLGAVCELLQPDTEDLYTMAGNDQLLKVRDDYLQVVSLGDIMEVPGKRRSLEDSIAMVVEADGRRFALLVDEPIGQQQVVVKNLENNYRKVPGVSAATILGDGRVALILDAVALLACHHARGKQKEKQFKSKQLIAEVESS